MTSIIIKLEKSGFSNQVLGGREYLSESSDKIKAQFSSQSSNTMIMKTQFLLSIMGLIYLLFLNVIFI